MKALVAIVMLTVACGLPVPDPYYGIAVFVTPMGRCTAFNLLQEGDKVTAVTASHCVKSQADLFVLNLHGAGVALPARVVGVCGDVTLLEYDSKDWVETLPVGNALPPRGGRVYSVGLGFELGATTQRDYVPLLSQGLWSGVVYRYDNRDFWMIDTPGTSGFSGGPVLWQGQVIGIVSIAYPNSNLGGWSGVTPLPHLTTCA